MKIIYYYQTFVGLGLLLTHPKDVDVIIVSSIHFGKNKQNNSDIFLNDNNPHDPIFNQLWNETKEFSEQGVTITCMVGGAGLAYHELFSNFDTYYTLLVNFIRSKPWIKGIDLDIEEDVSLEDVQMLIHKIKMDFGKGFIITMAPLGTSLSYDGGSMGGFDYKTLYLSKEGRQINWFNCQCYNSFTVDLLNQIVNNGYPENKIIMGMESGQFTDQSFIENIKKMKQKYPSFRGVYDWEYLNAPPNSKDPSEWAKLIRKIN